MTKKLLRSALLLGNLAFALPSMAQNASVMPEGFLPTIPGPVVRPQNASSSTMQNVIGASGSLENLYIHSWDVFSSYDNNGIAWRITDGGGGLINEDFIVIKYATDIDAVIYEDGGTYFVLAAYYYDDGNPSTKGHYYDIYKFSSGVLLPSTLMTPLSSSATFGRINVDANAYGLAITWCVPGTGIFAKAASLPGAGFGPDVLLPGTANYVDPDVCVRRGAGGSGTGLDLQIVFLSNTLTALREYRVPFFNILGGSSAGFTNEYGASAANGIYCPPRIACPDNWSSGQRWTIAMGGNMFSGGTSTEWTYAVVKNDDWSPTPTTVSVNFASYGSSWLELTNPVVAYNDVADRVTIGWITRQSTAVIPGTSDFKYLAKDVKDNGAGAPGVLGGSFNMISNIPGSFEPVLAFSDYNLNSNFDGMYIAFAQYGTVIPDYSMMYKSRPWSLSTFKGTADLEQTLMDDQLVVSPNPFSNKLSFQAQQEGNYEITLLSIDGKVVYQHTESLTQGQTFAFDIPELAAGTYVVQLHAAEQNIHYTQKLVKQ